MRPERISDEFQTPLCGSVTPIGRLPKLVPVLDQARALVDALTVDERGQLVAYLERVGYAANTVDRKRALAEQWCAEHGTTLDALRSEDRSTEAVSARRAFAAVMTAHGLSAKEVAAFMGRKASYVPTLLAPPRERPAHDRDRRSEAWHRERVTYRAAALARLAPGIPLGARIEHEGRALTVVGACRRSHLTVIMCTDERGKFFYVPSSDVKAALSRA